MWTKQQFDLPATPVQASTSPVTQLGSPAPSRSNSGAPSARLGASLQIKGQISGTEDLQIDGVVEGPITLRGHGLTVGPTAQLNSEVHAGQAVVYGKIVGNLHARERVDIKKDGSVVGDIDTARISIEDGAHFKGRIEIDPTKGQAAAD